MKFLLLMMLSFGVFAEEDGAADKFAEKKTMRLENLETRIKLLQESKACIEAASDKEAMKSCKEQGKKARMGMKEERRKKIKKKMKDS
jgi:hypothetical protein